MEHIKRVELPDDDKRVVAFNRLLENLNMIVEAHMASMRSQSFSKVDIVNISHNAVASLFAAQSKAVTDLTGAPHVTQLSHDLFDHWIAELTQPKTETQASEASCGVSQERSPELPAPQTSQDSEPSV